MLKRIAKKLRKRGKKAEARPQRYGRLFEVIRAKKCKRILEIGTWRGKHAKQMIEQAAQFHAPAAIEYYGFDLFELLDDETFEREISKRPPAMADVEATLNMTGAKVTLFRGNTIELLPESLPSLPKMDLIFIDGGHSLETIDNDWLHARQLMHDDTVVIFDDYWEGRDDAGCKKVIEQIDRQVYRVEVLSVCDQFQDGKLRIRFAEVERLAASS